jgi:hypothetical protein
VSGKRYRQKELKRASLKTLVTLSVLLAAAIVVAPGLLCYYYVPPRFWAVAGHNLKAGEDLASAFKQDWDTGRIIVQIKASDDPNFGRCSLIPPWRWQQISTGERAVLIRRQCNPFLVATFGLGLK